MWLELALLLGLLEKRLALFSHESALPLEELALARYLSALFQKLPLFFIMMMFFLPRLLVSSLFLLGMVLAELILGGFDGTVFLKGVSAAAVLLFLYEFGRVAGF
jgi:hypothetical protein